jgi:hypothetical protein
MRLFVVNVRQIYGNVKYERYKRLGKPVGFVKAHISAYIRSLGVSSRMTKELNNCVHAGYVTDQFG